MYVLKLFGFNLICLPFDLVAIFGFEWLVDFDKFSIYDLYSKRKLKTLDTINETSSGQNVHNCVFCIVT